MHKNIVGKAQKTCKSFVVFYQILTDALIPLTCYVFNPCSYLKVDTFSTFKFYDMY